MGIASNTIVCGDCQQVMKGLEAESIDAIVTDPPYGLSFMGKDWDKAIPGLAIWRECFRVLKPGAFAFILTSPRLDCITQQAARLWQAGFETGFTPLFWAYASGFPKAQNIGKAVDKRLGAERQVVGHGKGRTGSKVRQHEDVHGDDAYEWPGDFDVTVPATPQARALDGSYAGFQPKPAVEVIIVVMKPLSEKTYVDQALKTGKGVTWLDDVRIPTESPYQVNTYDSHGAEGCTALRDGTHKGELYGSRLSQGRFPANLLVSDDVLNDGRVRKSPGGYTENVPSSASVYGKYGVKGTIKPTDSGSFSKYFNLDKWAETLPFLIVPKASKSEKGKDNTHPTVKPIKLMAYLITLGSREGGLVLDPFVGSGTTPVACVQLGRSYIGIDISEESCEMALQRLAAVRRPE